MIKILDRENSVLNYFIAEMRDVNVHKDPMRFRRNLERVGEIIAYEISKTFDYKSIKVTTPINEARVNVPSNEIVIGSVLRAGLPFHQGFTNYFDRAGSAFISARRTYDENHKMKIRYDSVYSPSLEGKHLLLVDPMLATGASMLRAYNELVEHGGTPISVHFASVIASRRGADFISDEFNGEVNLWLATMDEKLTETLYIDPGMGDAGDLAFGEKL